MTTPMRHFRMNDEEYIQARAVAKMHNRDLSSMIRGLFLELAKQADQKKLQKAIDEVRKGR